MMEPIHLNLEHNLNRSDGKKGLCLYSSYNNKICFCTLQSSDRQSTALYQYSVIKYIGLTQRR